MDVYSPKWADPRIALSFSSRRRFRCIAARRRHQLRSAFELVYDRYYREGLTAWNRHGMRIVPHQLLDTSWVLIAERGAVPLGTLSVIEDGAMGLPMEQLYPAEIWRLRQSNVRLAELACFALQDRCEKQSMTVLRTLLRTACEIGIREHIDELVICVHPKRSRFYARCMGFEVFGAVQYCPWACGHPAIPMKLTLQADSPATDAIARLSAHSQSFLSLIEPESIHCDDRAFFWRLLDQAENLPSDCRMAA